MVQRLLRPIIRSLPCAQFPSAPPRRRRWARAEKDRGRSLRDPSAELRNNPCAAGGVDAGKRDSWSRAVPRDATVCAQWLRDLEVASPRAAAPLIHQVGGCGRSSQGGRSMREEMHACPTRSRVCIGAPAGLDRRRRHRSRAAARARRARLTPLSGSRVCPRDRHRRPLPATMSALASLSMSPAVGSSAGRLSSRVWMQGASMSITWSFRRSREGAPSPRPSTSATGPSPSARSGPRRDRRRLARAFAVPIKASANRRRRS